MSKTIEIVCPNCGQPIKITIADGGAVCVSFFDACGSQTAYTTDATARDYGYEFGTSEVNSTE